ncbi:type III secretion system chaperone [Estrella lausannensis]|uniref:Putative type III secretion chaperone SycE n=1 Tax=Estrella lausannensis TaxID=483423 RepID=A0A0H5DN94_9BACT|nr:type III secretion system chaperone [Estrella lausannensis]CRX37756.1 Putative type III secretion chaperone SycE [Estrella lausannensis]
MAKIDQLMKNFSKEIGADPPIQANVPGVYGFSVGDGISVSVVDKGGEVTVSTAFGPLPRQEQEKFYTTLMSADLFFQDTDRSTLGIDEKGEKLVIKKVINHEMDDKQFADEMEDFLNTVDFWKSKIQEFR